MKKLLTIVCSLTLSMTFAQKISIRVNESNENIGGGKNPSLVVSIYDASPEDVESKWRSLMKDYRAKVSTKEGVFADNAIISEINGNNTIDVYARAEKGKDNEVKFIVAFDLGGAFLSASNNKEKFNEAKKIVNEFALKTTREAIAGQRKAAVKVMENLQDDQKDLERDHAKLTSNIEDYKQKIEDYKKKIKDAEDQQVKNKAEQEKKKAELEAQKKVVDAITAKESSVD